MTFVFSRELLDRRGWRSPYGECVLGKPPDQLQLIFLPEIASGQESEFREAHEVVPEARPPPPRREPTFLPEIGPSSSSLQYSPAERVIEGRFRLAPRVTRGPGVEWMDINSIISHRTWVWLPPKEVFIYTNIKDPRGFVWHLLISRVTYRVIRPSLPETNQRLGNRNTDSGVIKGS